MSRFTFRGRWLAFVPCTVLLAACGSFNIAPRGIVNTLTPYKIEIVQGNFVSREQVDALKAGMTRQQVKETLGTPLMSSVFHADRWDYVFTLKRQGVESQSRKLAVFFNGNVLERFEGDPMPSEAEFVATLEKRKLTGKIPALEASEEKLGKFQAPQAVGAATVVEPPAAVSYPPLEPPAR